MPLVEDLAPYFADFGEAGTLAGVPVRGIFDEPGATDLDMAARALRLALPTAEVLAATATPYGATLVLPTRGSFTVLEHVPDGTGVSELILQRAA